MSNKLVGSLTNALVIGGIVLVGGGLYYCYKKEGSLSPISLASCAASSLSGQIQDQSDKFQCQTPFKNSPQFPTSPYSQAGKMWSTVGDTLGGMSFNEAVRKNNMLPNCK